MAQRISERAIALAGSDGTLYERAIIHAAFTSGGLWEGWIEFVAASGHRLRTGPETTQPDLAAIGYWSEGLEAIYFEGALARAERRRGARRVSGGAGDAGRRPSGTRAAPSSRRSRSG